MFVSKVLCVCVNSLNLDVLFVSYSYREKLCSCIRERKTLRRNIFRQDFCCAFATFFSCFTKNYSKHFSCYNIKLHRKRQLTEAHVYYAIILFLSNDISWKLIRVLRSEIWSLGNFTVSVFVRWRIDYFFFITTIWNLIIWTLYRFRVNFFQTKTNSVRRLPRVNTILPYNRLIFKSNWKKIYKNFFCVTISYFYTLRENTRGKKSKVVFCPLYSTKFNFVVFLV